MEENSQKRKIEFITINSNDNDEIKKSKSNEIAGSSNQTKVYEYKLNTPGDHEAANNSINNYIKVFQQKINKTDIHQSIQELFKIIEKLKLTNIEFIKQSHFINLFDVYAEDIEKCENVSNVIELNIDLIKELSRLSVKLVTPNHNFNAENVRRKVIKYTKALQQICMNIIKAEQEELSLDDLDNENYFTQLPRLYNQAVKLWKKREILLQRSISTGLYMQERFVYKGTNNEQINKAIQNYFFRYQLALRKNEERVMQGRRNKTEIKEFKDFSFFTIIDLKNELKQQINKYKIENFELDDSILKKIYKDLLIENQKRRESQKRESLKCLEYLEHLKQGTMVEENDEAIIKQLNENGISATKTMKNLIEEFEKKDFDLNGKEDDCEGKLLGWDDNSNDDDEDEEEEDEDEEENSDRLDDNDDDDDDD